MIDVYRAQLALCGRLGNRNSVSIHHDLAFRTLAQESLT
jgi:hypothetical protein